MFSSITFVNTRSHEQTRHMCALNKNFTLFGGIHFDIVDKSLALYLFLLEQEQGTSAHSILLKGLLPFFLQKCKSSFRAHSCSLSMNNLYNFFKKMLAHQFWPQLIVCNPSLSDCHLPKPEQRKGIWKACLHYNIVVRPWVQEVILRLDSRVFEVDRENDLKYNFMKKIMENLVQDNFQISWNWF